MCTTLHSKILSLFVLLIGSLGFASHQALADEVGLSVGGVADEPISSSGLSRKRVFLPSQKQR